MDMKQNKVIWISVFVTLIYLLILAIDYRYDFLKGRYLDDYYDIGTYYEIGRFFLDGKVLYLEQHSEYPPIASFFFVLPFILFGDMDRKLYILLWQVFMSIIFILTVSIICFIRTKWKKDPLPVLIMISPSLIYFSLMRFDILCCFFVILSIYYFIEKKYQISYLLLSISVFIKWYPALLFPVFIVYNYYEEKDLKKEITNIIKKSYTIKYMLIFIISILILILISVILFSAKGFFSQFIDHGTRGSQFINLYWLAEKIFIENKLLFPLFQILFYIFEFSIIPIVFIKKMTTLNEVVKFSVLGVFLFIIFARIDSPQWIIWYIPIALLLIEKEHIPMLLILSLLNYLVFPIGFDIINIQGILFSLIVIAKDIVSFSFIYQFMKN